MFIATAVMSVLLSALLVVSASGKFRRSPGIATQLTAVGVRPGQLAVLGALEVAGALGLLAGLFWVPLGIAAAIGVIAYFLGAITAHLRAWDRSITAPLFFLLLAIAALVLRTITA